MAGMLATLSAWSRGVPGKPVVAQILGLERIGKEARSSNVPGQNLPHNHHYVPHFLMKRFADEDGKINIFDRKMQRHLRKQNPQKHLFVRDFYRLKGIEGLDEFALERTLSSGESEWAPLIKRIIKEGVVAPECKRAVVELLSIQYVRTYSQHQMIRILTNYHAPGFVIAELTARQKAGEFSERESADVEKFVAKVSSGEVTLTEQDDVILAYQMSGCNAVAEILDRGWNFVVVSLDHPGFVLSDNVIALVGDWDGTTSTAIGPANAEEIWMPLDPSHALVLTRDFSQPRHILALSPAHARRVSLRLALESGRFTVYKPGTDPLLDMDIPVDPPRPFVNRYALPTLIGGTLMHMGMEEPQVEGERLLSGRKVRQAPRRPHSVISDGTVWILDDEPPPASLPVVSLRNLPKGIASQLQQTGVALEDGLQGRMAELERPQWRSKDEWIRIIREYI